MSAIFLLPVCLTYWHRKYTTRVNPHVNNSHQVWSWYDHQLPSFCLLICQVTLWPWPFDLEQMSYMASHVSNLATKYENPMPIRSWVMSYNVSRWLPLKVRTRPLRMRQITSHVSRGSKTITFLECSTRFAYSLCNFGGSTMKVIKVICENNAAPRRLTYFASTSVRASRQ